MQLFEWVLGIGVILFSAALIIVVMLQKSDDSGVNALSGGSSNSQMNRAQQRGLEGKLPKLTVWLGIILAALCVIFVLMLKTKN